MSDNVRAVNMEPHSVGELLTEVTRAHLHGGLPSAILKRIKAGVDKYVEESKGARIKHSSEEITLATALSAELEMMYETWKKKETDFFSM